MCGCASRAMILPMLVMLAGGVGSLVAAVALVRRKRRRAMVLATVLAGLLQIAMEEGKCGGAKTEAEGKCGEGKAKEGKCGEGKAKEGSCGDKKEGVAKPPMEGKCGEGKCGSNM
mgnify:CR=1 FL=1